MKSTVQCAMGNLSGIQLNKSRYIQIQDDPLTVVYTIHYRASFGTTKYCTYFLRHMPCPNPNCMYLHEAGDDADSYNNENPTVG